MIPCVNSLVILAEGEKDSVTDRSRPFWHRIATWSLPRKQMRQYCSRYLNWQQIGYRTKMPIDALFCLELSEPPSDFRRVPIRVQIARKLITLAVNHGTSDPQKTSRLASLLDAVNQARRPLWKLKTQTQRRGFKLNHHAAVDRLSPCRVVPMKFPGQVRVVNSVKWKVCRENNVYIAFEHFIWVDNRIFCNFEGQISS